MERLTLKLIDHSVKIALTKFVPVCCGLEGTIGSLEINENYVAEPCEVPIDTLVLTLSKTQEEDDDNEVDVEDAEE